MTATNEIRDLYRAGHLSEARALARRTLEHGQDSADVHYLLGLIEARLGRAVAAGAAFRAALERDPDHRAARNSWAACLAAEGRSDEALFHFEQGFRRFPHDRFAGGEGLTLLLEAGRCHEAAAWLERAQAAEWSTNELLLWTGRLLARQDRPAEAIATLHGVPVGSAEFVAARLESARLAAGMGGRAGAEADFRLVLDHDPRHPTVRLELVGLCCEHADPVAARFWAEEARRAEGDTPRVIRALALTAFAAGEETTAASLLRQLAAAAPHDAAVLHDAAQVLAAQGRRAEACDLLRHADRSGPLATEAGTLLARLLSEDGRTDEAREVLFETSRSRHRTAAAADLMARILCPPVFGSVEEIERYRGDLLGHLTNPAVPPVELADAFAVRLAPPFAWAHLGNSARPLREALAAKIRTPSLDPYRRAFARKRRRLAILVTAGHEGIFRRCMQGILAGWPGERVEAIVVGPARGRGSLGLDACPAVGFEPLPESPPAAARAIERLAPDLLYFWEVGTDPLNYALALQRLVPVQFTSWGTQGTTGLPTIDHYLSSRWVEPPDAAAHYTERLVLLSSLLTCISRLPIPSESPPPVPAGPGKPTNYVCIQSLLKIHPEEDVRFRAILEHDPTGRLILKGTGSPAVAEQLTARLARTLGDLLPRVTLLPWLSRADYFDLIRTADVLLDTRHFSAGSTIYDIFSANRPLAVRPGRFAVGRYAAGCCRRLGLDELVAETDDAYLSLTHRLAHDHPYRTRLHTSLARFTPLLFDDSTIIEELVSFCEAVPL